MTSSYRTHDKASMCGRIRNADKDNIYMEIADKDSEYLKAHCKEHFGIHFKINTLPYSIQHKALDYMKKFHLHRILIANEKYHDTKHQIEDYSADNYQFR